MKLVKASESSLIDNLEAKLDAFEKLKLIKEVDFNKYENPIREIIGDDLVDKLKKAVTPRADYDDTESTKSKQFSDQAKLMAPLLNEKRELKKKQLEQRFKTTIPELTEIKQLQKRKDKERIINYIDNHFFNPHEHNIVELKHKNLIQKYIISVLNNPENPELPKIEITNIDSLTVDLNKIQERLKTQLQIELNQPDSDYRVIYA